MLVPLSGTGHTIVWFGLGWDATWLRGSMGVGWSGVVRSLLGMRLDHTHSYTRVQFACSVAVLPSDQASHGAAARTRLLYM
jgi:hypothetical protein